MDKLSKGTELHARSSCFPSRVLKAIEEKQGGTPLNICLNEASSGASGTYNPTTKTTGFIYGDYISEDILFHELIHYYQDIGTFYPGFAGMTGGNPGYANMEFEAQLLTDIMRGHGAKPPYALYDIIKKVNDCGN